MRRYKKSFAYTAALARCPARIRERGAALLAAREPRPKIARDCRGVRFPVKSLPGEEELQGRVHFNPFF